MKPSWNLLELAIAAIIIVTIAVLLVALPACADEITCPQGQPCKIIVVSPQDEQVMLMPNGILDMATWSSRPLADYANAWRDKLKNAPAGKPFMPPAPEKK